MKNYHIYLGKYLSAFITTRWLQQQEMTKKAIFVILLLFVCFLGLFVEDCVEEEALVFLSQWEGLGLQMRLNG